MTEYDSKISKHTSIRAQVFKELELNPLNTAKYLCKILNLPYKKYKGYMNKLRYDWKYDHENERGSKCSNSHRACYVGCVLEGEANKVDAVNKGWVLSRARNRFLVFRERLGRVVWYETGRVLLNVRRPANEGKAKQLFCDAFFRTGLVTDVGVLDVCLRRIHVRGAHSVFRSGQRLPSMRIDTFADSHGVVIRLGDRSHPDAVEVVWEVQEQVAKLGDLAEGFQKFMSEFHGLLESFNSGKHNQVKDFDGKNVGVV